MMWKLFGLISILEQSGVLKYNFPWKNRRLLFWGHLGFPSSTQTNFSLHKPSGLGLSFITFRHFIPVSCLSGTRQIPVDLLPHRHVLNFSELSRLPGSKSLSPPSPAHHHYRHHRLKSIDIDEEARFGDPHALRLCHLLLSPGTIHRFPQNFKDLKPIISRLSSSIATARRRFLIQGGMDPSHRRVPHQIRCRAPPSACRRWS